VQEFREVQKRKIDIKTLKKECRPFATPCDTQLQSIATAPHFNHWNKRYRLKHFENKEEKMLLEFTVKTSKGASVKQI